MRFDDLDAKMRVFETASDLCVLPEIYMVARLRGLSSSAKNELLFNQGVNFNALPNWQKRGVGLYWESFDKISTNPVTGQSVVARRRRLKVSVHQPHGLRRGGRAP